MNFLNYGSDFSQALHCTAPTGNVAWARGQCVPVLCPPRRLQGGAFPFTLQFPHF